MNLDAMQVISNTPNSSNQSAPPTPCPVYFTVAQFAERNPAFSESAIRNIVFKADPRESSRGTIPGNGLLECGALLRLGRKVLIHEGRFFQWVDAQGANR